MSECRHRGLSDGLVQFTHPSAYSDRSPHARMPGPAPAETPGQAGACGTCMRPVLLEAPCYKWQEQVSANRLLYERENPCPYVRV